MSVFNYKELSSHADHQIEVVTYGDDNVAAECITCGCVLFDFNNQLRPLVRVIVNHPGYVAYEDDHEMIDEAMVMVFDDLYAASKDIKELKALVEIVPDPTAAEDEIPESLQKGNDSA